MRKKRWLFITSFSFVALLLIFVTAGITQAQAGGQNPTPIVITLTPPLPPTPDEQATAVPRPTSESSLPPDRFEPNNDADIATVIGLQAEPGLTLSDDDVDTFTGYLKAGQMVTLDHANLVVIDGVGDLVPRLKRKAAVTRLLGEQLAYVDIDGVSLAGGFNPLATTPGETEVALVHRWQRWFQGMNVHPQGIELLAQAQREGVEDIPGLRKWLKQSERQGHYAAVSSLGLALNRLTASRALREWLEWPANRFDTLPEGAFFFACKGTGWDRQQLLQAVLLGAMQVAGVRLIVHGVGKLWHTGISSEIPLPSHLIFSNGPLLPQGQLVFTETEAAFAGRLAARFGHHDEQMAENLQLLGRREAVILVEGQLIFARW